ncbi:MAG: hypothetical protein ACE5KV_09700 [Thermoplasmata archaeon]
MAAIKTKKRIRAGLMLGIADLGNHPRGFLGAFYPVATNIIVLNRVPLNWIKETNPELYKPYVFHVLLHEYVHAWERLMNSPQERRPAKYAERSLDRNIQQRECPRTIPKSSRILCTRMWRGLQRIWILSFWMI